MANQGNNRPPLVAPVKNFQVPPEKAPKKKPVKKSKKRRNGIKGFFQSILRAILRVIWWVTWRVAVVLALVLGAGVFYYYKDLPPAMALMDDRKRGSVTMMDRNGDVFAWRGDQFGGLVSAATVAPALKNAVIAKIGRAHV